MSKTTFSLLAKSKGALPIAAGFMLMPSFFFAQTQEQIKAIRKETNVKALDALKKGLAKITLTEKQLRDRAKKANIPFSGETNGKFFQLKGFTKDGAALYYETYNIDAGKGTQTDKLHSPTGIFNLEGEGMTVYEWDGGGIRRAHQEFGDRVTQKDRPASSLNDHANHVAGTMIASGINGQAKGMAPKAKLNAYDFNNDETEVMDAIKNEAPILSNHSYGVTGGWTYNSYSGTAGWHWMGSDDETEYVYYGKYTVEDLKWDMMAQTAPYYLIVKAAGNPRGDGPEAGEEHFVRDANNKWVKSTKVRPKNGGVDGFDTINQGSLGKNFLTVGAAEKMPNGYTKPSDVVMASFSGFGPIDDGRIKPDISGIGVDIVSTTSTGNTAYTTMSGTSMSSPNVTGSLLLLQEHYTKLYGTTTQPYMKAATLKALAIGTANEAGAHDGPDYATGWGLLNAYKAATAISTRNQLSLIEEKSLGNKKTETIQVTASGTEPLVVTIAWTDPVASWLPDTKTLDDNTSVLVNDLDVVVTDASGNEHKPWVLNPATPNAAATRGDNTVDNVEQVVIKNPVAGQVYTIKVSHKDRVLKDSNGVTVVDGLAKNTTDTGISNGSLNVALEAATSQDYSLVVTGINQGVATDLAVNSVKIAVDKGQYTNATPVDFEIVNKGNTPATGGKLKWRLIDKDNNDAVVASGTESLANIAANETIIHKTNIDLSKSFVNYVIEGEVEMAGDAIAVNNKSSVETYGTLVDLTSVDAVHNYSFENDIAKNGWISENVNKDATTWKRYDSSALARTGDSFAVNFLNGTTGNDDWLFSNPLKLKGNVPYRVTVYVSKFQTPAEKLKLYVGNQPISTAMTTQVGTEIVAESDFKYHRYSYEFTVPTDQVAYLGIHNSVPAGTTSYAVALDDVNIQQADGKPEIAFEASKVLTNTFDTITFTGDVTTSASNPATYEWTFEPSTVSYQEGTSASSLVPKIKFDAEGTYSVTLKAKNATGEVSLTKNNYVKVANSTATASFTATNTSIYTDNTVSFTNTSVGNPVPDKFQWTVTPSDGVEFVNGTSETTKDAVIKFTKQGEFKVALTATSLNNSDTTEDDEKDSSLKPVTVKVTETYPAVRKLEHTLNDAGKLDLTWERPVLNSVFFEDFNQRPRYIYTNNANGGFGWEIGTTSGRLDENGQPTAAARSFSGYLQQYTDMDDWIISEKIAPGAEIVRFYVRHQRTEKFDVYVTAPSADPTRTRPRIAELRKGTVVHTHEVQGNINWTLVEVDIKDYTSDEFHIAIHQRTKKEDKGLALIIDDLEIGYKNKEILSKPTPVIEKETLEEKLAKGEEIVSMADINKTTIEVKNDDLLKGLNGVGWTNVPTLTGYEIVKDGNTSVYKTTDIASKSYSTLFDLGSGVHTYDVYALYSDGKRSEKRTVIVGSKSVMVSPNPSADGRFVAAVSDTSVRTLTATVYDMSGRLIYQKDFQGNTAEITLPTAQTGVYILHLTDNKGETKVSRLVVQ